jgi:hypothetical protein
MNLPLFRSALRPITRVIVGLVAIPVFRFIMRRIFRLQDLDDELEKDLEQWFRGALLLLAASANMEHLLFGWMDKLDWMDRMDWLTMGLRLMLAIGVIEAMPDQELFAVIHPGPPKIKPGKGALLDFWKKKWAFLKGVVCQHLNRSSPVLAMMAAIVGAELPVEGSEHYPQLWERWVVGWVCYLLAITQYLIIGLVTSRDRAMNVLSEFDRAVAERRQQLIEEFHLQNGKLNETASQTAQPGTTTTDQPVTAPADSPAADAGSDSDSK